MKTVQIQIPDWMDEREVLALVENILKMKKCVSSEEFIDILRALPELKVKEFKWEKMKKAYYEGKVYC